MQWTLTDRFSEAGHPPLVDINSHVGVDSLILQVKPGETHILNASGTYDPDHAHAETSGLDYVWMLYGDVNGFHSFGMGPKVKIEAIDEDPVSPQLADNAAGFSSHIRGSKVQVLVPPIERNPQTGLVTPDFQVVLQVTNSARPYPIRSHKRVVFSLCGS
jgi:hypothetical protein